VINCGALLFDLDGTLVDSTAVMERTWTAWSSMHGFDPSKVIAAARGRRTLDTVREFVPAGDLLSEVARLEAIELSELHAAIALPGARDTLAMLTDSQWAVVASGTRRLAFGRLEACHLPRPSVLIGAEDVGRGKPDPEGYMAAALRLAIDTADCIAFEDAPAGIQAASLAGCTVVGLTTTHRAEQLTGSPFDGLVPSLAAIRIARKDHRLHLTLRDNRPAT
jgi:mannitol-1-/sugar-/sorbitol-6-phosphatase